MDYRQFESSVEFFPDSVKLVSAPDEDTAGEPHTPSLESFAKPSRCSANLQWTLHTLELLFFGYWDCNLECYIPEVSNHILYMYTVYIYIHTVYRHIKRFPNSYDVFDFKRRTFVTPGSCELISELINKLT